MHSVQKAFYPKSKIKYLLFNRNFKIGIRITKAHLIWFGTIVIVQRLEIIRRENVINDNSTKRMSYDWDFIMLFLECWVLLTEQMIQPVCFGREWIQDLKRDNRFLLFYSMANKNNRLCLLRSWIKDSYSTWYRVDWRWAYRESFVYSLE